MYIYTVSYSSIGAKPTQQTKRLVARQQMHFFVSLASLLTTLISFCSSSLYSSLPLLHPPDGICHASVVFGMGKELFQTEEVQSNEPVWNQEALL